MELLVSTDWLANEIGASDLRVVDATWFMPDAGRNAQAEYEGGHIPSAVFMDLEELADAKKSILEERKIGRAQDNELAAGLVAQALTNRTMAYTEKMDAQIEASSLAEVNAAIRKALDPAKFLYVYAGDFVAAAKK